MMNDRPAINPWESEARCSLVTLAQEMLAAKVSFFEGAVAVLRLRSAVGGVSDHDVDFNVFVLIDSETDHLPLKAQQHLWSAEALARLAPEYEKTEAWAAGFTPAACERLIQRFGI